MRCLGACWVWSSAKTKIYQCHVLDEWFWGQDLLLNLLGLTTEQVHDVSDNSTIYEWQEDSQTVKTHTQSQELSHARTHFPPLLRLDQLTTFPSSWLRTLIQLKHRSMRSLSSWSSQGLSLCWVQHQFFGYCTGHGLLTVWFAWCFRCLVNTTIRFDWGSQAKLSY